MGRQLREKKNRSILHYILVPVCFLSLIEAFIFWGVITVGGVNNKLDQNARDIVQERVINRNSVLQNEMLSYWSKLDDLSQEINQTAKQLDSDGIIDIEKLDQGSEYSDPLVSKIADSMIHNLRNLHTNSIFLVFNNHDLDGEIKNKPGIFVKDLDPFTNSSDKNSDLLIERGSNALIKQLDISTDIMWKPTFSFSEDGRYGKFIYCPYEEAKKGRGFSAKDLGYWSYADKVEKESEETLVYSIPLILDNGYVYGVLGVGITTEYLSKILPDKELHDSKIGRYCLAVKEENSDTYRIVYGGSKIIDSNEIKLRQEKSGYYLEGKKEDIYVEVEELNIYNSNTPYEKDQWVLMAIIPNYELLAFSAKIKFIFFAAVILAVIVGSVGGVGITLRLSYPIISLAKHLFKADNIKDVEMNKTNISEIDYLVESIKTLNNKMLETTNCFNTVLTLSSMQLAAFEINLSNEEFFITRNFFKIFKKENVNVENMPLNIFKENMEDLKKYIVKEENEKYMFHITEQEDVFIEMRISMIDNNHIIGLVEDITERMIEKHIIEYERDHDTLTGLLNRGAFHRKMNDLFLNNPDCIKKAAFLMLDIDNLKYINDNLGHDCGDTYIRKASETFISNTPRETVISRMSGDEFNLFFYGYDSEKEIEKVIENLKSEIDSAYVTFGKNEKFHLKVSGGIAWYPKDADTIDKLQLYADYAMYKVKKSVKGKFNKFNIDDYKNDYYINRNKEELEIMIRDEKVQYYYQPIVNARTGDIVAYEALMRSTMSTFKNPEEILKLAKEENKLQEIERITFFKAMEGFVENIESGNIKSDVHVFINSIPNQIMTEKQIQEFESRYKSYLSNIVVEITEAERPSKEYQEYKRNCIREHWGGELALDDYGSGYNGEKMLLEINPKYIKIDMEIVTNIHADIDKRKIVENIVSYAHERNMLIIAEGIETVDELKQLIELDVDLCQGYLFAKPQKVPEPISENLVQLVLSLNTKKSDETWI